MHALTGGGFRGVHLLTLLIAVLANLLSWQLCLMCCADHAVLPVLAAPAVLAGLGVSLCGGVLAGLAVFLC